MTAPEKASRSAHARIRDAIKAELAEAAVAAFEADGFDATTVDSIAAQVGVSRRTFFRYFDSKEDPVFLPLENLGAAVAARLAERPSEEAPLAALRAALDVLIEDFATHADRWRTVITLNRQTPSLRARHLDKLEQWLAQMTPVLARRMDVPAADPTARLYCTVLLGAWESAVQSWYSAGQNTGLATALDDALQSLTLLLAPHSQRK